MSPELAALAEDWHWGNGWPRRQGKSQLAFLQFDALRASGYNVEEFHNDYAVILQHPETRHRVLFVGARIVEYAWQIR